MTDTRGTRHAQVETPLGDLTLVAECDDLSGVYFPGHWHLPKDPAFGDEVDAHTDPVLSRVAEEIREYLSGARTDFDIPVRLRARIHAVEGRLYMAGVSVFTRTPCFAQ